jgi:hypothetical protein
LKLILEFFSHKVQLSLHLFNVGDNARPSIAALCASMDAKASRYAASIRVQAGRTEIIADLANMVKELLKTFYQTCGRKPDRILFYRDGVSEGQFAHVLKEEISAVRGIVIFHSLIYFYCISFDNLINGI